MNSRYQGPAVFPPAHETRKRIEVHLDSLSSSGTKPEIRAAPTRKKLASRLRRRLQRGRP